MGRKIILRGYYDTPSRSPLSFVQNAYFLPSTCENGFCNSKKSVLSAIIRKKSKKKGVYNDDFSTRIDSNSTRQNDEGVKMQKITVSFPDEKVKEIMRIARERGESKSTILRMAMELYLRREKREKGDELLIL